MAKETPSFYAIIPATIRYDKDLPANAKLLYGEITALSEKHGYCFASNAYFAKLYEVSTVTISRWINILKEKGYLSIEIDQENGNVRHIKIDTPNNKNDKRVLTKTIRPINKNVKTPINKNVKHSITSTITTDNTTSNNKKEGIFSLCEFEEGFFLEKKEIYDKLLEWNESVKDKYGRPLSAVNMKKAFEALTRHAKDDYQLAIDMIEYNKEVTYQKLYPPPKEKIKEPSIKGWRSDK